MFPYGVENPVAIQIPFPEPRPAVIDGAVAEPPDIARGFGPGRSAEVRRNQIVQHLDQRFSPWGIPTSVIKARRHNEEGCDDSYREAMTTLCCPILPRGSCTCID